MTAARQYHGQYTRTTSDKWHSCRRCIRGNGGWIKHRRFLWIFRLKDHYLCTNCLRSEAQAKNRELS